MQITPIASGSSGNAYHIQEGASQLLIECGLPIKKLREALSFNLSGIDACLVSHEHQDHAKAVPELLKAGVDVYASQGTIDALGLASHRLHGVGELERFTIGGWAVLSFETQHDAAQPFGFVIASGSDKLLYATDTFYLRYRFEGLTHIMIECNYAADILAGNVAGGDVHPALRRRIRRSHMSLQTVKEMLQANDLSQVREIWLMHLSSGNSDERRFKAEIEETTGKPTYIC